jgi:hypothetical protein
MLERGAGKEMDQRWEQRASCRGNGNSNATDGVAVGSVRDTQQKKLVGCNIERLVFEWGTPAATQTPPSLFLTTKSKITPVHVGCGVQQKSHWQE